MRRFLLVFSVLVVSAGAVFLLTKENKVSLIPPSPEGSDTVDLPRVPEAEPAEVPKPVVENNKDIGAQKPLTNPPAVVKAVYVTSWSAGTPSKIDHVINLLDTTEVNAVVIDIKDYSGLVAYNTDVKDLEKYGAEEVRIAKPNTLIKRLHDEGIYVIARITVFQDPILAEAHPEWALKNGTSTELWKDNKGLAWIDSAFLPLLVF